MAYIGILYAHFKTYIIYYIICVMNNNNIKCACRYILEGCTDQFKCVYTYPKHSINNIIHLMVNNYSITRAVIMKEQ